MAHMELCGHDKASLVRSVYHQLAMSLFPGPRLRARTGKFLEPMFKVKMDKKLYDHNIFASGNGLLYRDMLSHTGDLADEIQFLDDEEEIFVMEHLANDLSRVIWGSNAIDKVGAGFDGTMRLCRKIFKGDFIHSLEQKMDTYNRLKADLQRRNIPCEQEVILRNYREISQHCEAMRYIFDEVYLHGRDLSEHIIRKGHRILTSNLHSGGGVYRHEDPCDESNKHTRHEDIPGAMTAMIQSLNAELSKAVGRQLIDPVMLAAKYSHEILHIRPFFHDNGRIARLVLNVLLFKYGGVLAAMGQDEDDRDEYREAAATAAYTKPGKCDSANGEVPTRVYDRWAGYVLGHARDHIVELVHIAFDDDDSTDDDDKAQM